MNRIKELRVASGLTQPELADLAGTTKNLLVKLEVGTRRLSDHWAERLAPHLGVQPHVLFMPPEGASQSGKSGSWIDDVGVLRSRMKEAGVTQAKMAEALGVARPAISHLLSGTRALKAREIPAIERLIGPPAVSHDSDQLESKEEPDAEVSDVTSGIAQRIRSRIEELGLSQKQVSAACGFSPARLHNYISRNSQHLRTPDADALVRLATALQTTTDALLGIGGQSRENGWKDIVAQIAVLEGVEPEKAAKIVDVTEAALQILASLPEGGDQKISAQIAAHAAWQARAPR